MERDVTWCEAPWENETVERRLAQCEAVLSMVSTGVIILEPIREGDWPTLRVSMVNELGACYFGRIGDFSNPLVDAEAGLRACGLLDLALMVSLTGEAHMQEALPAPGPSAAGQLVDLAITPLGCGTVTITFDDVTAQAPAAD